ncbi:MULTISPECIES: DUF4435 domain-containing protein [Enterobacteriaceae]|uniref:Uncharacterized protein n=1 Tax=Enterobacter cloacae TaxID=550 RepID=A0A330G628_ENTCL|nr:MULTISPECIES: DUF4435 domain-containing protein [Enterobacteriaceae]HDS2235532.1 DUF4435 domain-containing protein [Klebsiella michiganensis]HED1504270.1 DUF4435 domain-containing protein [Raoultella ornithinolytica]MDG9847316.1 DUF4435 domain-containing protein [Klebsiella grimontii]MDG9962226.1 DUF4435 domain-containing protein [Klebsiella grimontii]RAZ62475.1 hypothetical protein DP202_23285 [Enterobacter cloacae]
MREFEWHIKAILETKITEDKRALIVEGKTDELVFTQLLKKVDPQWETNWVLAEVGGKRNVVEILSKQPTWLGIVDRDEWDNAQLNQRQQQLPNLLVLPRFCIENYLTVPGELWHCLPQKQRAKLPEGRDAAVQSIAALITENLERWVQFGALWAIINPLWDELRLLGFNRDLLDPELVLDEQGFRAQCAIWHSHLEPQGLWQRYQDKLAAIQAQNNDENLRTIVHGKKFFKAVVTPAFRQLFAIQSAISVEDLFRQMPVPADLAFVWQRMDLTPEDN